MLRPISPSRERISASPEPPARRRDRTTRSPCQTTRHAPPAPTRPASSQSRARGRAGRRARTGRRASGAADQHARPGRMGRGGGALRRARCDRLGARRTRRRKERHELDADGVRTELAGDRDDGQARDPAPGRADGRRRDLLRRQPEGHARGIRAVGHVGAHAAPLSRARRARPAAGAAPAREGARLRGVRQGLHRIWERFQRVRCVRQHLQCAR